MTQTPIKISSSGEVYLDFLRAFAANLVIYGHIRLIFYRGEPHTTVGSFAVVVFFLLSGFLISWSALSKVNGGQQHLSGFLSDRIARIFTPYIPVLILVMLIDYLFITRRMGLPGLSNGICAGIGNMLMLQDYPVFQALDVLGKPFDFRIRPYNSAEPFWTVAIEFWIYIAFGVFVFAFIQKEKTNKIPLWIMVFLAVPVVVWNMGGGAGKALSLIWMVGGCGAVFARKMLETMAPSKIRQISGILISFGLIATAMKIKKYGFDPFDLQIDILTGIVLLGGFLIFNTLPPLPQLATSTIKFFAAYSYSLYLVHNTVLAATHGLLSSTGQKLTQIAIAVALSHVIAYGVYLAFERHHKLVSKWLKPRLNKLIQPVSISPH